MFELGTVVTPSLVTNFEGRRRPLYFHSVVGVGMPRIYEVIILYWNTVLMIHLNAISLKNQHGLETHIHLL